MRNTMGSFAAARRASAGVQRYSYKENPQEFAWYPENAPVGGLHSAGVREWVVDGAINVESRIKAIRTQNSKARSEVCYRIALAQQYPNFSAGAWEQLSHARRRLPPGSVLHSAKFISR